MSRSSTPNTKDKPGASLPIRASFGELPMAFFLHLKICDRGKMMQLICDSMAWGRSYAWHIDDMNFV
ncbi:unnamed protein product [Fusarium graminearum]|uniref:Chromosome 3, complete genome n=1 Tax=Gibberella zeae (strain ATCC MYA-4620 / CBS 123657 / FGSC 9075 / NRRL 31084 / PH-1) TaxID=229533 RepID=A0A098E021_GIBZE|nr:unnamed protein product [Fusarium graminearum]